MSELRPGRPGQSGRSRGQGRRALCVAAALLLAPTASQSPLADPLVLPEAVRVWLESWMPLLITTSVASSLVALATVIHAFVRGHPLWGIATLLIGVTAPAYMIKHMPLRPPFQIAAIALMVSPLAVLMAMMVQALVDPPVL